ncbi:MAG: hypothetical protein M3008_13620 [Chloroflexota bacterium]|nr:hypothetical protein [Chloroflexota bacterium]
MWRVTLPGADSTDIKAADSEDSHTPDSLSAPTPQLQSVMDQWLRPLVAEIRELATENGRLKLENEQLRATLEVTERAAHRIVQDAPYTPERTSDEESPPHTTNVAPGGAGEAERALEKPQRWPWWMRILAGK